MMDYMRNNPYTRQLAMRDSPIMRQADPRSQRRMMANVAKGLPADIDPQRIFSTGAAPSMPQYGAVLGAMGFGGGWGQVGQPQTGSTKAERDASRMAERQNVPMGGLGFSQPQSMGISGDPMSFTSFGQSTYGGPQPTAKMAPIRSVLPEDRNQLTGFGEIPRFPFSNY